MASNGSMCLHFHADVAILDGNETNLASLVTDSHLGSGVGLDRNPGQHLEVRYIRTLANFLDLGCSFDVR